MWAAYACLGLGARGVAPLGAPARLLPKKLYKCLRASRGTAARRDCGGCGGGRQGVVREYGVLVWHDWMACRTGGPRRAGFARAAHGAPYRCPATRLLRRRGGDGMLAAAAATST